jgi:hypothetical protein
MITTVSIEAVGSRELLARTRALARQCSVVEADLLVHIGEVDERKLFLDGPFPSMFAFCVGDLGFSDDAAYNRITVARAGRRLPAIIDALRSGTVHLAGLRLLAPHLTSENHREIFAEAAGKSKRDIEELVARLAPQPPVPDSIRKLPNRQIDSGSTPALQPVVTAPASPQSAPAILGPDPLPQRTGQKQYMKPLAPETYKIEFTAGRQLRDKLCEMKELLRHRVPDGNLATIVEAAIDLLAKEVKKERFAVGREPRTPPAVNRVPATTVPNCQASRRVPDPVKRAVYERDGGRCTWTDHQGRRCVEKGLIEFDHVEGFARTREHTVDGLRLLCRAHNQAAAEKMYGRAFMERKRTTAIAGARPGTSSAGDEARAAIATAAMREEQSQPLFL